MIDLRLNARDFQRRTSQIVTRHLPQAEVWALNWTAQDVIDALQTRMRVVFDRPTRFTLNAFRIRFATRGLPTATVTEKDIQGRRHFLKVQEEGGARPQTGLERMLAARTDGSEGMMSAVPTSAARLDANGNWSAGERNRAVAQVIGQRGAGSPVAGGRVGRGASYFTPRNGGLSPGIWKRTGRGQIAKVVSFIARPPRYDKKLGFEDEALRVYRQKFPENFTRALRRALSTAR